MLGSVNKYTFSQPDDIKGVFKIRLDHLWSLLLGAKYEDLEGASDLFEGAAAIKVERLMEIDNSNALLRYGDDSLMLVNFRVEAKKSIGGVSDYSARKEAIISMFEFDKKLNTISPSNFIIISTAIARSKEMHRD